MSVAEAAEPKARFYLNKESKICRVVFWPWENFTLCMSERQLGRFNISFFRFISLLRIPYSSGLVLQVFILYGQIKSIRFRLNCFRENQKKS